MEIFNVLIIFPQLIRDVRYSHVLKVKVYDLYFPRYKTGNNLEEKYQMGDFFNHFLKISLLGKIWGLRIAIVGF